MIGDMLLFRKQIELQSRTQHILGQKPVPIDDDAGFLFPLPPEACLLPEIPGYGTVDVKKRHPVHFPHQPHLQFPEADIDRLPLQLRPVLLKKLQALPVGGKQNDMRFKIT